MSKDLVFTVEFNIKPEHTKAFLTSLTELIEEMSGRVGPVVYFENPADRKSPNFNMKVRRRSGVADFHVHRLRHSMASIWIDEGAPVEASDFTVTSRLPATLVRGQIGLDWTFARGSLRVEAQAREGDGYEDRAATWKLRVNF